MFIRWSFPLSPAFYHLSILFFPSSSVEASSLFNQQKITRRVSSPPHNVCEALGMRIQGSGRSPQLLWGASPRDKMLLHPWKILLHDGYDKSIGKWERVMLRLLLQTPWPGLWFLLEGEKRHQSITDHPNLRNASFVLFFPYEEPPSSLENEQETFSFPFPHRAAGVSLLLTASPIFPTRSGTAVASWCPVRSRLLVVWQTAA